MPRFRLALLVPALLFGIVLGTPSGLADHNEDSHSANMIQVANVPKAGIINSDLAFWDKLLFAGNFGGFRILRIADPSNPEVLADVSCNGAQGDVGVWDDLLFVSVDRPQTKATCDGVNTNPQATQAGFEGIRIFDVSNPRRPAFIKGVPTNCGSHTHTVVPDLGNDRVLVYVSHSLPAVAPSCTPTSTVDIVEVLLARPEDATVIASVDVAPAESCHDIGVFLPEKIAAAACISEGQLWDITDPGAPVITDHIVNAEINIWHSGAFTYDGLVAVFGDEFAGAAADGGCVNPEDNVGRIWFYERFDTATPLGSYKIPRPQGTDELCTAHNYNLIPVPGRYLLVSGFYEGGTTVVEFTNPAAAREIAFYDPRRPSVAGDIRGTWSSYWYNGLIYTNDIDRGVDVFKLVEKTIIRKAIKFNHLNPQTQEVRLS